MEGAHRSANVPPAHLKRVDQRVEAARSPVSLSEGEGLKNVREEVAWGHGATVRRLLNARPVCGVDFAEHTR